MQRPPGKAPPQDPGNDLTITAASAFDKRPVARTMDCHTGGFRDWTIDALRATYNPSFTVLRSPAFFHSTLRIPLRPNPVAVSFVRLARRPHPIRGSCSTPSSWYSTHMTPGLLWDLPLVGQPFRQGVIRSGKPHSEVEHPFEVESALADVLERPKFIFMPVTARNACV